MHRFILNVTDPAVIIDHINGDTLDNRRENLRIVTEAENLRHKTVLNKNNTTGLRGVHIHPNGKFRAQITYNKKRIHLGYFQTKEKAGKAFNEAAIRLFGLEYCGILN